VEAKFEQGLALIRQGLAILEKSSKGEPVGSMVMSPRVAKLGRIAHLHLQAFEGGGGHMTLGQSREIRRRHSGPTVRSTANLFGTKDSGAILYRKGPAGQRPRDTDPIRLTKEGERLADEYRRLQGNGRSIVSRPPDRRSATGR
jgi:hypothetical protein